MAEHPELPQLPALAEPELTEPERIKAASERLYRAARLLALPVGYRMYLRELGIGLDVTATHHAAAPCDTPGGCAAVQLADVLLGREVTGG